MLYPLRFRPLFRSYLWGGRRLATLLGKSLPDGEPYAESWEIVDRGSDQSVVLAGPLAGTSLADLVRRHGHDLFGLPEPPGQFPWLFKFLDAHQILSVQVHPNDRQLAAQGASERGKTEAWVVVAADPGSYLYAGLRPGIDAMALERAIDEGRVEDCLHRIEPVVGDCYFLPAGTVHALGAGLVVAEIQQSSDTTYRLFDWNRGGPDGQPRPLHQAAALAVIDFAAGPVQPIRACTDTRKECETLVACEYFILQRWTLQTPLSLPEDNRLRMLAVVDGGVDVQGDPLGQPLRRGETMLIPASCRGTVLSPCPSATLLQVLLPVD